MPTAVRDQTSPGDLSTVLHTAVTLHQSGQPSGAQPFYQEALQLDRDNPDALHLSGILAHQAGQTVEALELIDRALTRLPGFAEAHNTRGNLLRALGRPDDALGAYRQAIALAPADALSWNNLGNALRELGRPEEALRAYGEAVAREPNLAEAHLNLGIVRGELGRDAGALTACETAVRIRPDMGLAWAALGRVLHRLGRLEEAIEHFRRAVSLVPDLIPAYCDLGTALSETGEHHAAADALQAALALDPAHPEAHLGMGDVCKALGYLDQALSAYRQAISERPDFASAHLALGRLLLELHRPMEAVVSYRAALTFRPDNAPTHVEMGAALLRLGRAGEAIVSFRRGLDLNGRLPSAWHQLGRALDQQRRSGEAADAYSRAIVLNPEFAEAHWDRALALLSTGRYEEAWGEYVWRRRVPELQVADRDFGVPRWDGSALGGRRILVHAEGGIADTLFFVRYLPLVAARGGRVVFECDQPLNRLLEAMPALSQVITQGGAHPAVECHVALEDLPGLFGTGLSSVPYTVPYLPLQTWSGRIPLLPPADGLRVGLIGLPPVRNTPEENAVGQACAALYRLPGVTWYLLSPPDPALGSPVAPGQVRDLAPLIRDTTDAAALLSQLDLVMGTDTPLAHLAGGLGLPLWILLGSAPAWRWSTDAGECPWYPTARPFQQPGPGDWTSVIEEVRRALAQVVAPAGT